MSWAYAPDTEGLNSGSNLPPTEKLAQSVTWRGKHSPLRTWLQRWKRTAWMKHLSGLMLPPLTAAHGVASWIWSLPDSPANLRALQVTEGESKTADGFGPTSNELSEKCNLPSCSWKMCPGCEPEDWFTSFKGLPRWGSMLNGVVLARKPLAPPTDVTGCGSLPTPIKAWATVTARDWRDDGNYPAAQARKSPCLPAQAVIWLRGPQDVSAHPLNGQKVSLSPSFCERLMGLPINWTGFGVSEMELAHWWQHMRSVLWCAEQSDNDEN